MRPLVKYAALAAGLMLLAGCGRLPGKVDFPRYAYRSDAVLELVSVERTDTATVLSFKSFFIPRWYINISSGAYLTDGKNQYRLTGAEGITPDEELYMGEDGNATFKLFFEPLPRKVREVSLIEQEDAAYAFNFYRIDLSGKHLATPEKTFVVQTGNEPTEGKTTVEVRMPCSLAGLPVVRVALVVNPSVPEGEHVYLSSFDDNGTAIFAFEQDDAAEAFIEVGNGFTADRFRVEPGGHIIVTVDGSDRNLTVERFGLKED